MPNLLQLLGERRHERWKWFFGVMGLGKEMAWRAESLRVFPSGLHWKKNPDMSRVYLHDLLSHFALLRRLTLLRHSGMGPEC